MTLQLIHTHDERLVAPEVVALLRRSLAARGSAVLLAPSLAVALRAQRELAAQPGLALGVACTTPDAWASLRWGLYGDGRAMVTPPVRAVLMSRLLERGDVSRSMRAMARSRYSASLRPGACPGCPQTRRWTGSPPASGGPSSLPATMASCFASAASWSRARRSRACPASCGGREPSLLPS